MSQLRHGKFIGLEEIAVAAQYEQRRHAVALGNRRRRVAWSIVLEALKYLGHLGAKPVDDLHVVGHAEGHGERLGQGDELGVCDYEPAVQALALD